MQGFVEVAKVGDVPPGRMKQVAVGNEWVVLLNVGGEIIAISDTCTHAGCSLSEDGSVQGDVMECSCHGSQFNIRTGVVVSGPAEDPLSTYAVRVAGDRIHVGRR